MRSNIVATALWMMETTRDAPASPATIAATTGVSVFHLSRAFAAATGLPPARYHRLRRLSVAAHAVRETDAPIALIALDAGYGTEPPHG